MLRRYVMQILLQLYETFAILFHSKNQSGFDMEMPQFLHAAHEDLGHYAAALISNFGFIPRYSIAILDPPCYEGFLLTLLPAARPN